MFFLRRAAKNFHTLFLCWYCTDFFLPLLSSLSPKTPSNQNSSSLSHPIHKSRLRRKKKEEKERERFLLSSFNSRLQDYRTVLDLLPLCISSTDIRENTVRSGHQHIGTLYAPNNVTYPPERVSINLVNAPDDSTLQCDCGHINCPLCNLMMNLEMTDPALLS